MTRSRSLLNNAVAQQTPSVLAGNVGDVQGEAGAPLARTSDEGALGRAPRTRTQPAVSLDVLNAANVSGRGTSAHQTSEAF